MTSRILEMASQSQGSGAVGEILPSNHSPTLEQMTEDFKRLISGMMVQLETMYNQVSKFQELHKQVSSLPELMDTAFPQLEPFSRAPDIPESVSVSVHPGPGGDKTPVGSLPTTQGSAEKEAKQLPQDPKFKATPGPQPSTRRRFLSETEEQDSQPVWIKKPQFWQDSLTQELWKLFRNSYENHQGPSKERKDSGLSESELKPEPRHRNSLSDSELLGIFQKDISQLQYETQESSGRADSFLKPLSWDAEDTQHSWKKQDALLLQSDTVAVPQALQKVRVLKHRELVLAMTVSCFTRHVFTCSRSGIKVWNLMSQVAEDRFPESHLKCGFQAQKAYLRTCLLSSDSRTLFGGGHNLPGVSVWDLAAPSLYEKCQLPCTGLSCQALASTENNMAFGGFTDGRIRIWDLRSQGVIRDLEGPVSAIKSLMVRDDKIWTGGLDTCLRCWDLREAKVLLEYRTQSQIMSLSHSPTEDWLLLGLVSGQHCLFDTKRSQAVTVGTKEKTILGLKFSQNGQWWVSVGMDGLTTIHSMPTGAKLLQAPEAASVSCCDMTEDGRLVFTGSKDCASVYQIQY